MFTNQNTTQIKFLLNKIKTKRRHKTEANKEKEERYAHRNVVIKVVFRLIIMQTVSFLVAVISLSLFLLILYLSLCIDVFRLSLMLASPIPPSFLDTYIVYLCHLTDVSPYASSLVFLFSGLLVKVLAWFISSILQGGQTRFLSLDGIPTANYGFERFSHSSEILLFAFFFLSSPLFGWCPHPS